MPWGEYQLSQLKLDQHNVRTGDQADQRAALQAIISDQKQKLVNLALDLLDLGPSPGEPIWVTADLEDKGQHIVLEGNRRVASFKLLENPSLAEGTEVAAPFAQMAKEFAKKPRRKLEAQVFSSRAEAEPWIQRRHMSAASGVGLQRWRSLAIERAKSGAGGSIRRSLLVLDYLDDGTDEFGDVGEIINAKATTVDRVLNAPALGEALGVHIDRKERTVSFENGDEIAGRRLLRDLISAMAMPDFTFSTIRDSDDRDRFVRGFTDRAVRAPAGTEPNTTTPSAAAGTPTKVSRPRLTEPTRNTLAPRSGDRPFNVSGVRLNRLYRECRDIKLVGNENAGALLLRVFVELSSEAFLVEKHIPIPPAIGSKKGKSFWGEIGISLTDKVTAVLEAIDIDAQTKRQLKKARVAISSPHTAGSIDTLHAYFHNLDMNPDAPSLRDAWDTWENYLRLLHANRK